MKGSLPLGGKAFPLGAGMFLQEVTSPGLLVAPMFSSCLQPPEGGNLLSPVISFPPPEIHMLSIQCLSSSPVSLDLC